MVAGLKVSPTKAKGLEIRIQYFLSQVMTTNENWTLNKEKNFYRNICSTTMKSIIGKDYYFILDLLTSKDNAIVEDDSSWSNFSKYNPYCKGYRLTARYNTGEYVFRELPTKFSNKVIKYLPEDSDTILISNQYNFLLEQYQKNPLKMNPLIYGFISEFGSQLIQLVEEDNIYQKNMIYNLIGRWLYHVDKFETQEYNPKVSATNHRLNSIFTNIPKVLRGFVECNGKPLYSVDLSACQPYILGKVMDRCFFNENGIGFNLFTIYEEVYNEKIKNNFNTSINHITSNCTTGSHPFMWGLFFTPQEVDSIREFQQIPFHTDYYRYVVLKGIENDISEEELQKKRTIFKKSTMYILFDSDNYHRNNNPQIKLFNQVYPGVNKWIETCHTNIGKSTFSLIMQRCESWLLLLNVGKKFLDQFPNGPLFTIHDGLYTYEEYTQDLASLILTTCNEIIGTEPGFKIESPRMEVIPRLQDVENEWKEIKHINSEIRYERIQGGVFSKNIELGKMFLNNTKNRLNNAA